MTEVHELLVRAAERVRVPSLDLDALRRSARRRRARRRTALVGAVVLAASVPFAAVFAIGWPAGPPDRLAQPVGPATSGAPSAQPTSPPAALEAVPRLLQVVQIDGSPWGPSTAHFGRGKVTAGKDRVITPTYSKNEFQSVAVAFEPLAAPGDCVQRAVLTLPTQATGVPGELRAYPSAALSLAGGRVPPNGGRPNTLLDNRPSGLETVHPDGSRSYDVTELVRLWSDGAPFPSEGRSVPPGSPIVVLVRPPAQDPGTYWHSFDVAASPPVLRASLSPDCPAR